MALTVLSYDVNADTVIHVAALYPQFSTDLVVRYLQLNHLAEQVISKICYNETKDRKTYKTASVSEC